MRRLVLLTIAASSCGCFSLSGSSRQHAFVDDITQNPPFACDVVAVDGKDAERSSHPVHTLLPLVELRPGVHTLTVRTEDAGDSMTKVSGTFEAGKNYRIKSVQGKLSIEEFDYQSE